MVPASITGWTVLPFTKTETHEDKGNEFGRDLLGLMGEAKSVPGCPVWSSEKRSGAQEVEKFQSPVGRC